VKSFVIRALLLVKYSHHDHFDGTEIVGPYREHGKIHLNKVKNKILVERVH
jgi:hypothetical protein